LRRRIAAHHPTASVHDRPFRSTNLSGDLPQRLVRNGRPLGTITREVHRDIEIDFGRIELHVLGQIDDHWAGTPRAGDVEGFFNHPRHVLDIGDQVVVLGDPSTHFDNRRFLERIGTDDGRRHLAGDAYQWDAIELGVRDRRD